jgi:HD-GYP domain-containing protein (c-di-GMP phosphodiesterase class II)
MATVLDARYLAVALHDATAREEYRLAAIIDTGQGKGPGHRKENATLAMAAEMLGLFADKFKLLRENEQQIDLVTTELAQTYEELVLLHKISTNMEIVEPDANFLQMACDSLTGIVDVEGIAILQERTIDDEKRFMLVAGSGLIEIDEQMTVDVYDRLVKEMRSGKEALLDSEVDAPFKHEWPETIRNIIVVPLCGKEKTGNTERTNAASNMRGNESRIIALMVAVNRVDKRDFDSTVVKLFTSVASECAVFVENNRLFNDLKELFIGSLKALTRSIDAKDRYTRGHSERVAFISKWIAERMAEQNLLDAEQVPRIYLAGLLHDVGKIGIDEAVLCKKGKLTRTELSRLRMHPSIAGSILSGIKQMREIIPGIVCHHEWVDGNGYPNGMKADDIPLMGKIVGLADSFDAMTSERVYRDARTVEETLDEIQGRIGVQFDPAVARVFLESDVYRLWDLMQEGVTTAYGADDFSRYGAEAVGSLIR